MSQNLLLFFLSRIIVHWLIPASVVILILWYTGFLQWRDDEPAISREAAQAQAFPSTYRVPDVDDVLIKNVTVLDGTGKRFEQAYVYLQDSQIADMGSGDFSGSASVVIDGAGAWVTPGLIDVHSHLGNYPAPNISAAVDINETTDPRTSEMWAEHGVWPQDPQFRLALAGGVTTLQILPGSANLFGGRGVTVKNVPASTVQAMKFPGAPYSLKMACGENPKRFYGGKGRAPATRMGNVAGYRKAWIDAQAYLEKWQAFEEQQGEAGAKPPKRDLQLETLAEVLRGNILVHNHCYRADEMAVMIDIAKEFGYKITAFHHAIESYKIADLLAEEKICSAMWADWWGFKLEAFDMVKENIALVEQAGACAIVHSDDPIGVQRLNQEAAKAMAAGNKMGLAIAPEHAIRWLTANAAEALGIASQVGSLEVGKQADLVLWNGNPFSVFALAEKVFIDGRQVYDRKQEALQPKSDFELGILPGVEDRP